MQQPPSPCHCSAHPLKGARFPPSTRAPGLLPLGSCSTPSWQPSPRALPPEPPWATLWATATQPARWGRDSFWTTNPSPVPTMTRTPAWLWVSLCSSLGLSPEMQGLLPVPGKALGTGTDLGDIETGKNSMVQGGLRSRPKQPHFYCSG